MNEYILCKCDVFFYMLIENFKRLYQRHVKSFFYVYRVFEFLSTRKIYRALFHSNLSSREVDINPTRLVAAKEEISVFYTVPRSIGVRISSCLSRLNPYSIFISICLNVYLAFLYHKEFICSSTLPIALFVPLTVTSFLLSLYLLAYSYPSPRHILISISHSNS